MPSQQFCEKAGLSRHQLRTRLESSLLEAEMVDIPGGARRQEFAPGQLERSASHHRKSVSFAQMAAADLPFDDSQAYILYDGRELQTCRDASAAIAAVVRAKRWCSAVGLAAVRRGLIASTGRCQADKSKLLFFLCSASAQRRRSSTPGGLIKGAENAGPGVEYKSAPGQARPFGRARSDDVQK
jgi:hypothetical protein